MSAGAPFDDLEKQYFTIKDNFNELIAACQNDDQRNALRAAYAQSRDNYNTAMNLILDDNDPQVGSLLSELSNSQNEIENSLTNLQDITTALNTITAAVSVGTKIVAMGTGA